MNDVPFNRRLWLAGTSLGALSLATTGCATQPSPNTAGVAPTQWTDQFGLVKDLPKDTSPLVNELSKYPRCRYCGMERAKFSHTRHLLVYEDDSVEGTCSLHCSAISLSLNMDRGPKAIYAGDAGSKEAIKPLVLADKAHYVIDPSKPGTMTRASKFAYADKAAAEAAASGEAAVKAGAKVVGFDQALTSAYLGMAEDTVMLRKRRGEMRRKMAAG
ncbi:nitrous oxide reductase accessory protein NosL [Hydrogenophaga sp.]|uniref:nitrous oxide reductase accessory protein NosL n=1 Tax=Hydrogenophaga sp. TaxID=1904254 RepID=UPI0035AE2371